jgi:multimeric flavodoxin WrbA
MRIIAVNGSPRETGNTATLLNNALAGAASHGAKTEVIYLYNLDF